MEPVQDSEQVLGRAQSMEPVQDSEQVLGRGQSMEPVPEPVQEFRKTPGRNSEQVMWWSAAFARALVRTFLMIELSSISQLQ
jgi:hypothetical protein